MFFPNVLKSLSYKCFNGGNFDDLVLPWVPEPQNLNFF